jgi:insulysin
VEELAKAKLEKPKRLSAEAARIWREISIGTRVFDRPQREVEVLRQLTLDDLR